ncbi:hypothetical protein GN956_G13622 [Arapaima gigas]
MVFGTIVAVRCGAVRCDSARRATRCHRTADPELQHRAAQTGKKVRSTPSVDTAMLGGGVHRMRVVTGGSEKLIVICELEMVVKMVSIAKCPSPAHMELPKSSARNSVQAPGGVSKDFSRACSPTNDSDSSSSPRGHLHGQTSAGLPSSALAGTPPAGQSRRSAVRKSKTHDCVVGMGGRDGHRGSRTRLVSSASFSGLDARHSTLLGDNRSVSTGSREIIDYRNLTPQAPFVPSIAKSLPKKRISLRKPRKAIKDLLGMKRHKQEKATSPQPVVLARRGNLMSPRELYLSSSSLVPDCSDALSDISVELCSSICEDVASLKSFGSHTGCGEIFADEEHHLPVLIPAEPRQRPDSDEKDICESRKASPVLSSFQGGVEQMASPAHAEILDLLGLWGSLNRAVVSQQSSRAESKAKKKTNASTPTPTEALSQQLAASPERIFKPPKQGTAYPDKATPKSDKQEIYSASDEGYYDYISPALEDSSRGSLTPCLSGRFPRDSYSGDALYELFYDPNESGMSPIADDNVNLSDSICGQASDLPLSMYSFHVGAEEKLTPPLTLDFVNQELVQSSWKGKECLLKLCDTEISLAMGIMNWLKQKTLRTSSGGSVCGKADGEKRCNHRAGEVLVTECQDAPGNQPVVEPCDPESPASKERIAAQHDASSPTASVPSKTIKEELNLSSPECLSHVESQIKTPTSGFCFRIFNKDSPLTPNRELKSPMRRSPGSTASTVFLLAINRESLCESCKKLLKRGSKELYLCTSCVSFVEYIKTSDMLSPSGFSKTGSAGTPRSLPRAFLESPISPCRMKNDVSLLHLLEQCISQMSSVSINGSNYIGGQEKKSPLTPLAGSLWGNFERSADLEESKEQHHKYLRSRHKVSSSKNTKKGRNRSAASLNPRQGEDLHAPGHLGLVATSGSDDLILDTYRSPCSDPPRPTYLSLSNSAYSKFAGEQSQADLCSRTTGQPPKRPRRHRRSTVNRDVPCGSVLPDEKRADCKQRMKE